MGLSCSRLFSGQEPGLRELHHHEWVLVGHLPPLLLCPEQHLPKVRAFCGSAHVNSMQQASQVLLQRSQKTVSPLRQRQIKHMWCLKTVGPFWGMIPSAHCFDAVETGCEIAVCLAIFHSQGVAGRRLPENGLLVHEPTLPEQLPWTTTTIIIIAGSSYQVLQRNCRESTKMMVLVVKGIANFSCVTSD